MSADKKVNSSSSYHDMRAPPRRRVKGDDIDEQPVFLRKAFTIITNCPSDIGGWSEEGDAVIIKDVKEFAEKVIPTAYRHNNFSSFVRQLNFYGFRKVKSDCLNRSDWWVFRHPQFLRDQPQLLSEIKRSVHFVDEVTNPSGNKEVSDLKHQIHNLTDKLNYLHDQVDKLTTDMTTLQVGNSSNELADGRKRKLVRVNSTGNGVSASVPLERGISQFDFDYFMNLEEKGTSAKAPTLVLTSSDDNMDDQDLNLDGLEDYAMDAATPRTPLPAVTIKQEKQQVLPEVEVKAAATATPNVQDIPQILACLSPELKMRFVDKLAESMGKQLLSSMTFNLPTATATATATPCADVVYPNQQDSLKASQYSGGYPSTDFVLPSGSKAPEIALPLATAALTAFIMSNLGPLQSNAASVAAEQQMQAAARAANSLSSGI